MFVIKKKQLGAKNVIKWCPVTFGTVPVLIARKNAGACYISAISCHTHTASCRAQQCWKQDQKYKRPRPRLVWVWDRSCHKTVVSDTKTGCKLDIFCNEISKFELTCGGFCDFWISYLISCRYTSWSCSSCCCSTGLTENDGPKMTTGREVAGEKITF